jgi:cytochrome c oxidase cbb3-type subunit 3
MWLFVITVVFAAVYLAFFPGLGSNAGALGWSSRGQFEAEQARARADMAPVYARFAAMTPEQMIADSKAMGIGERLFLNNCAQCHGSDARGSKGFPNLTDNDWLGEGTPAYIVKTITEGRIGAMPPMAAAVGSAEDVRNVAQYVLSLSGTSNNSVMAQLGKAKFGVCAACHGPDGKGSPVIGAPNLTDKIWLHGWGEEAVVAMVTNGKTNAMPAQGRNLTPEQIQVLAAYVWGLSHGNRPVTAAN